MANDLGGLNLSALANQAHGETRTRQKGGASHLAASLASLLQEQGGYLKAGEESQGRGHRFQQAQQALDHQLARREQAMREARAYASMRSSRVNARKQAEYKRLMEEGEEATWMKQQRFQTDENIRQATAIAELEARLNPEEEESDLPSLRDFGGSSISPLRGAALNEQKPGFINLTQRERDKTAELINKFGEDPALIQEEMRDFFGNRTRAASYALWDAGYGLQG
jgi:hypothetical protein